MVEFSKIFGFIKKLALNLAIALCIILFVALLLIYGFGFKPYSVQSASMSPAFNKGDLIIVKKAKTYKVGDVLQFNYSGLNISHRLLKVLNRNGKIIFVCHGDALGHLDGSLSAQNWQYDAKLLQNKNYYEIAQYDDVQLVEEGEVSGKVETVFKGYGTAFDFASSHKFAIISWVVIFWLGLAIIDNELDMHKRAEKNFGVE